MRIIVAAVIFSFFMWIVPSSFADDGKPKELTVRQAIGLWSALTDGSFKEAKLAGLTRMMFARDIEATYAIWVRYNASVADVRRRYADDWKRDHPGCLTSKPPVCADDNDVPKAKIDDFNREVEGMLDAPSGFTPTKIKAADLCLDATEQGCSLKPPVKNDIPPGILAGILPIVEQ